jgi:hypothetical protein
MVASRSTDTGDNRSAAARDGHAMLAARCVRAAAAHGTRTHAGRPARTHALPRPFCVEFKLGVFKKKI